MMTNRIMRAITYATKKHDGQKRKVDQTPYITHPYRVAMLLKSYDCSDDLVIAGLLHDVAEDTEGTIEEIETLFGPEIAFLVESVTEADQNSSWDKRKKESIETIRKSPLDVKLLVCADKIDNMQSMLDSHMIYGDSMWHAFHKGKEDQKWYYEMMYQSVISGSEKNHEQPHSLIKQFKLTLEKFIEII